MIRTVTLSAVLGSLIVASFCLPASAQNKSASEEYDYYSLALTSVSSSAREAAKLEDIPQRIELLIQAAKILPRTQRDEATGLLDIALRALKEWVSDDKTSWSKRHTAASMSNKVLAVYAELDSDKATAIQKEIKAEAEANPTNTNGISMTGADWFAQFSNRRTIADQTAGIALGMVDTDPDKALALVLQSLRGGIVSHALVEIVQKLTQNGNRDFLNKFEISIGQLMAANVTLDWSSLSYASAIIFVDKDMPPIARSAILDFFMGSLEAWSNLVSDPSGIGKIDSTYISTVFTSYFLVVRPLILQYALAQLPRFDLLLNQVAPLVPEKTRSRLQAFQPETFREPRDRLNDILKDPNPARRDLRLVRFVSQLLRDETGSNNLDLAAEAVNSFSDSDTKAAFSDLLAITRINISVKQQKFVEAQSLASSISSADTRAWALLALSTVAARSDRVIGFGLINNALESLDKASPSPNKVELSLLATAMLAKDDPSRAFDTLSRSVRYANSSQTKIEPPAKPAVGFGLDAQIAEMHTKIGVVPENLADIQIDPAVFVLGIADWFRANQMVEGIREPALRLQLKLHLAAAVLAQGPMKQRGERPSVKK